MKYEDEFDALLNEALTDVREAEPRVGLEGRVLAGVRAKTNERKLAWWKWAAVAAAVVLVLLAVGVRRGSRQIAEKVSPKQIEAQGKDEVAAVKVLAEEPKPAPSPKKKKRTVKPRVSAAEEPVLVAAERAPFPVPSPLTAEEKVLQRWASRKPDVLAKLNDVRDQAAENPITISPLITEPIDGGEK